MDIFGCRHGNAMEAAISKIQLNRVSHSIAGEPVAGIASVYDQFGTSSQRSTRDISVSTPGSSYAGF